MLLTLVMPDKKYKKSDFNRFLVQVLVLCESLNPAWAGKRVDRNFKLQRVERTVRF